MKKITSLKNRLISYITFGLLIPLLLIGVLTVVIVYQTAQDEIRQKNHFILEVISSAIEKKLSEVHRTVNSFAKYIDQADQNLEMILHHLQIINSYNKGILSSFVITDQAGFVLSVIPKNSTSIGIDMSVYDFFKVASQKMKTYWSPSFISPRHQKPVATLTVPLSKGYLIVYLDLTHLLVDLKNQQQDYWDEIAIIDQLGVYIAHSDYQKVIQRAEETRIKIENINNTSEIYNHRQPTESSNLLLKHIKETGWTVIIYQSSRSLDRQLRNITFFFLAIFIIVIILTILLSKRQIRSLEFAIQHFEKAVGKITKKEYQVINITEQYTEFSELGNNINQLASKLLKREQELKENEIKLQIAYENIKAKETLFRSVFEQAAVGIVLGHQNGSFLRVNQRFCDIIGYKSEDLTHLNFKEISHPEELPENELNFKKLYDGQVENFQMEKRYIRKDGSAIWADLTVSMVNRNDEQNEYHVAVIEDITKRKNVEFELQKMNEQLGSLVNIKTTEIRASNHKLMAEIKAKKEVEDALIINEKKYREFIEGTDDLVIQLDQDCKINYVNHKSYDILGYYPDKCVGLIAIDFIHPEDQETTKNHFQKWLQSHLTHATHASRLVNIQTEQVSHMLWNINIQYDSDSHYKKINSIGRDVSELKQVEEKLIQAKKVAEQANQAKSEFLANISHELRSPMHHILSFTSFGIEKIDKPKEKLWHYFKKIKTGADRLMFLLNDLLDLAKMESGRMDYEFEFHNINKITNEILSEMAPILNDKEIKVDVRSQEIEMQLSCDYYKIGQVIRNLMSNAVKFSHENGYIKIKISQSQLKVNEKLKPCLQYSVEDNGVGIPIDEIDDIFSKFTQSSITKTGAGGTGLGLAICNEIIKAHFGKIWAENNQNGGAIFTFAIPYTKL
ncbi:MAG: PAS domain S-box protein [Deltaproteobacteria bacterium]|jgi:PAS domain S-box-containing protein|nr:PAS domain S-box protein [Deltaproteobacteria bacterium]